MSPTDRPVSPEAAPPQRDDELCANCGYTYAGHISNTGVLYPDWKPSGRYAEAAPNLLTRVLIAEAEQWDAEHPSPLAEAAPPRATTARVIPRVATMRTDAEINTLPKWAQDEIRELVVRVDELEEIQRYHLAPAARAPLAAHPATTPEPDEDDEVGEIIRELAWLPSDIGQLARAALIRQRDALSTLERDAARTREAERLLEESSSIALAAINYYYAVEEPEGQFADVAERVEEAEKHLRTVILAALTPSGEPTTTPETRE